MQLPKLLHNLDDEKPARVLARYYSVGEFAGAEPYTGARFDTWDSAGTRAQSASIFTADDLVAVSFLSVDVKATAAIELLDTRRDEFSNLLEKLGADRDLVNEREPWPHDWPGWQLWSALTGLPGVGPTTASKLFARKRPRLRPIYDEVVADVIGGRRLWEPLRAALVDGRIQQDRLIALRDHVGLPEDVSAIRVFDVLAWMEGKGRADP